MPGRLRELHQPARALADLRERARDRVEHRRVHGLDRVDREDRRRARRVRVREDLARRRSRRRSVSVRLAPRRPGARASRSARPTPRRSRTARRPRAAPSRQPGERLDQQRRLADARIAAEQHELARDQPAAEHAIELADAASTARSAGVDLADVGDRDRRLRHRRRPPRSAARAPARSSSSTSEFHSWQAGQRPSHLASTWPHACAAMDAARRLERFDLAMPGRSRLV